MATATKTPERMKDYERRFIDEVWNDGDFTFFEEYVSEDYVGHWYDVDYWEPTYEGFRTFIEDVRAGFSDFEMKAEFMLAEDDMIVVGFTTTGTHDGEFMGIPPTEIEGRVPGIMAHRFDEDGMLVESWAVWDTLGMLQQLGVAPEEFTLSAFLETGAKMAKQDVLELARGR